MKIARNICRQIAELAATLFVSSFVIYGALYLAPGSPIDFLLGGENVTPAQVAALNKQYGLNKPFWERYFSWINEILHGHLGLSITFHDPVWTLISERLETTGLLVAYTLLVTVVMGVLFGSIAAIKGGARDTAIVAGTSGALATPPFVAGVILVAIFAVKVHWFPVQGAGTSFPDRLWHLTLPACALAVSLAAYLARVVRTSMLEEMQQEYVLAAISRGLPRLRITTLHVVRNALLPLVTLVGIMFAYLITGTIVIEQVFALNGLGSLLVSSVTTHDFPVVQAIALLVVVAFIVVNSLVDVAYRFIDPRLRSR